MPKPHGLHEVMRWHSQAWLHGTWTKTWHAPSAFFFSKQKAALHGRLCSGRGARRRGRWWAKKSLGSKWLLSLHWASGAVQVLARGGFCLPFMGVPVVLPAFGLRLDGHGGLLRCSPPTDSPNASCWQAGHETGSAVGACPGMPRIAKGRPGLSAPQAVDAEVVSRVWQTEVWRFAPGLRWHHELAAQPEWNGAWQPLLLAWQHRPAVRGLACGQDRGSGRGHLLAGGGLVLHGQSLQIQTCNYMKDKIKKTSWFAMEAWKSLGGSGKECWPDGGLN